MNGFAQQLVVRVRVDAQLLIIPALRRGHPKIARSISSRIRFEVSRATRTGSRLTLLLHLPGNLAGLSFVAMKQMRDAGRNADHSLDRLAGDFRDRLDVALDSSRHRTNDHIGLRRL